MATKTETQKTIVADEQIVELYWERNDKAIRLTDDKYGQFLYGTVGTDKDTETIVSVNFQVSDLLDNHATEILTEDECYAIAINFLSLVAPDTNWDLYTLSKTGRKTIGEGKPYCHNYYGLFFQKYIDGIATTDCYGICITEFGSIMSYRQGDCFDEQEIKELNVDYTRAEAVAKDYAEELCEIRSDAQYSLSNPSFLRLGDGTYALEYGIEITYPIDNGQEITSGLVIVIPVESN